MGASERIVERIRREGPIPSTRFVEIALYGDGGFFTGAAAPVEPGATSSPAPRSGPLFGALVARALDGWWRRSGRARSLPRGRGRRGPGRLARRRARRRARCAPALRYVLVERSAGAAAPRSTSCSRVEPFEDALGPVVRADDDAPRAGHRHGPDRHRARRASRPSPSTGSCSPTSCSTTCRSGSSSAPPTAGSEVRVGARRRRPRRERSCPRRTSSRPKPTTSPRDACPSGAALPVPTALRGLAAARARSRSAAACSSSSTTPRPRAELVERGAARVAAHLPRPRAGRVAARRARRSGHHRRRARRVPRARREPRRLPRSSSTSPRPSGCATLGIDDLVADARARRGTPAPTSATSRRVRHRSRVTEAAALARSRRPRRAPGARLPLTVGACVSAATAHRP